MSFTNVSVISFTKQFWVGWNLRPKMSATAAAMVGNKRKNVNVLDRYMSEKKSTKETNLRKLGTDEGIKIKVWWVKGEREKKPRQSEWGACACGSTKDKELVVGVGCLSANRMTSRIRLGKKGRPLCYHYSLSLSITWPLLLLPLFSALSLSHWDDKWGSLFFFFFSFIKYIYF